MAQATHTPAVTRTEVVEVKPATITLHLSMEEAAALLAVSRRIGGSQQTRRRHFDCINNALLHVGVSCNLNDFDNKYCRIYFKEMS